MKTLILTCFLSISSALAAEPIPNPLIDYKEL
jgi:hypothetical protein